MSFSPVVSARLLAGLLIEREREMEAISRALHDGICQELTAVGFLLDAMRLEFSSVCPEIGIRNTAIQEILERSLEQARGLSRQLRCGTGKTSLEDALRGMAHRLEQHTGHAVDFRYEAPGPLLDDVRRAVIGIAEEAVENVVRHSGARRTGLRLTGAGGLELEIRDDGRGFEAQVERVLTSGLGIPFMERYAYLGGGHLSISSRPECGTSVRFRLTAGDRKVRA